jgi:hypothetical protein
VGIERAVTRWYLQRQACQNEITALEAKLTQIRTGGLNPESKERMDVENQLINERIRLRSLGPCPRAMMG